MRTLRKQSKLFDSTNLNGNIVRKEVVNQPIKFEYIGDGLELVALAGVTTGYCYKCELASIDPNVNRGEKRIYQPIPLFDELTNSKIIEKSH